MKKSNNESNLAQKYNKIHIFLPVLQGKKPWYLAFVTSPAHAMSGFVGATLVFGIRNSHIRYLSRTRSVGIRRGKPWYLVFGSWNLGL